MATSNRILSLTLSMLALVGCANAADETSTELAAEAEVGSIVEGLKAADVSAIKAQIDVCRTGGSNERSFVAPTAAEMASMASYTSAFMAGKSGKLPAGFTASKLSNGLTLVCQKAGSRRGGGAYLLRSGTASDAVVEVPHSFHDLGSLDVGLGLFMRTNARALLVNTAHRYRGARCTDSGSEENTGCASDMAHTTVSDFHAVHGALLAAKPGLTVVAVHGFAPRAGDPDVIVSHANTVACWNGVADQLNAELPSYVTLQYPEDIHELGGTLGAQAKQMQKVGGRMMHLELSKRLRTSLASDSKAAESFARAVASGLTKESC